MIRPDLDIHAATLRNGGGVLNRLRHVREQGHHFFRRPQILLRRIATLPPRVGQGAPVVDAHSRFVRLELLGLEKAHVVRRHYRGQRRFRQVQNTFVVARFVIAAGTRDLEIKRIAEQVAPVMQ